MIEMMPAHTGIAPDLIRRFSEIAAQSDTPANSRRGKRGNRPVKQESPEVTTPEGTRRGNRPGNQEGHGESAPELIRSAWESLTTPPTGSQIQKGERGRVPDKPEGPTLESPEVTTPTVSRREKRKSQKAGPYKQESPEVAASAVSQRTPAGSHSRTPGGGPVNQESPTLESPGVTAPESRQGASGSGPMVNDPQKVGTDTPATPGQGVTLEEPIKPSLAGLTPAGVQAALTKYVGDVTNFRKQQLEQVQGKAVAEAANLKQMGVSMEDMQKNPVLQRYAQDVAALQQQISSLGSFDSGRKGYARMTDGSRAIETYPGQTVRYEKGKDGLAALGADEEFQGAPYQFSKAEREVANASNARLIKLQNARERKRRAESALSFETPDTPLPKLTKTVDPRAPATEASSDMAPPVDYEGIDTSSSIRASSRRRPVSNFTQLGF